MKMKTVTKTSIKIRECGNYSFTLNSDFNHKEDFSNQHVGAYHIGRNEAFYIYSTFLQQS